MFRALVEEAGASWAGDPHELLELARVLAVPRSRPRPRANADATSDPGATDPGGLAILTCSGGDSGNAADEAERLGVELPPLAPDTRERLVGLLPSAATAGNPLDYTSLIWADRERLAAIVATVGADPAIDQLLLFHDTPAELAPEVADGWKQTRGGLVDGANSAAAGSIATLFASTLPDLITEDVIRELDAAGIASVGGLATALLCAREARRPAGDAERMRAIAAAAGEVEGDGNWLGEAEAKGLLADAGVPVPAGRTTTTVDGAIAAAAAISGPLVLKLSSPQLQHKSEIGAIAIGVDAEDEDAVASEAGRLLALAEERNLAATLLVEVMTPPGVELFLSATRDGVIPALVIGLGGIWTEALADVAVVPLPAPAARIEAALRSLRGASLLTGGRGAEPIDLAGVAATAAIVGDLLLSQDLQLIELNPLIASPGGCVAADALIRR